MWSVFFLALTFSYARAAPAAGTCMCVTTNHVNVRDAAGLSSHVVASMSSGECYKFNGGVLTKDGYTWYELQDVHGHHRVWAASNYLHTSTASHCSGGSSLSASTGGFASGIVSAACLQCLCVKSTVARAYTPDAFTMPSTESGCKAIGCHFDVNSDSCGYFQIKEGYWRDCGSPGSSWHACADDLHCSSQCVQNYMKRYASHYHCPMTCEGFAREHNGGPNGCHHSSTLGYWAGVQSHAGCSNVH